MIKATEEKLFIVDGQKSALHCLVMKFDRPGICANAHYHKYCEILYGIECDVDMIIGDKTEKLRDGDICFIYPGEPHYLYSAKEKNEYCVIKFFPEILFFDGQGRSELSYLINMLQGNEKSHKHVLTKDNKETSVEGIIKNIFTEWYAKNTGYEFAIRGQILILYSIILRLMERTQLSSYNNISDGKFQLIHDAIIYTTENLDTVTESLLAKRCFMSSSNFSKSFKKIIGKSYNQFLTDARIAEAKRQLIASNKPITDIAYSIGFSSSSHFIATFKRQTDTTPLQYRNKYNQVS